MIIKNILRNVSGAVTTLLIGISGYGQTSAQVPEGWHLKDLEKDSLYGISLDKAYEFVQSKNLKPTTIIVGIVDSGIDTTHEDLKSKLWVNKGEIPGNGIDDDKNGYIDDVHGWNFIGGKDINSNVTKDSYEAARIYWGWKSRFDGKQDSDIAAADKDDYNSWLRAQKDVFKDQGQMPDAAMLHKFIEGFKTGDQTIRVDLKKEEYTCKDLANYKPSTDAAAQVKQILTSTCQMNSNDDISNKMILSEIENDVEKLNNTLQQPRPYRDSIVKDNYKDINDKYYGNNNLLADGESAMHGTHVAGIIGADRNNNVGIQGVANNVELMAVRTVPDGDEHDKDVALAIRYAVDNGARVINMSFGKAYSPEKKWVDEAVKYAVSKNVLLVHAAGNDHQNNDTTYNFPSAYYLDKTRPASWITVGASGDPKAGGLVANFSNYGKKEVDVFAPGVRIYSTIPGGNKYANEQGTSMASPVVAGVAAFILSYYPDLTAVQVKEIIEKSVYKPTVKVKNPESGEEVLMSELCTSGGIVNAYEAIKLASTYKTTKGSFPEKKSRKNRK